MATVECLTLFFFVFLPHISAKKCHELGCRTYDSPQVRFPFRLRERQRPRCGYSSNFDLSCNQQKQTILTLPSSSGDFTVESISYTEQSIWINDQNKCIPKRLLDNDFRLAGSPFQFDEHGLENYTFCNCSAQAPLVRLYTYHPITCLSSDNYKVIALPTRSWRSSPHSLCNMISTAMVPIVNYEWLDTDFGVRLTWGAPDCRSCESSGRVCGFKNVSSLQLDCSTQTNGFSGLSNAEKFRLLISLGVPGLVCITMFALYIYTLIRDRGRINEPITELSSVTIPQIHVVITGLNDLTIESYPKTQLGEKWEFPSPEDSTCPICLCEYQPEETIRTIPECNHHFHASCIDEWLRKNPTCPVCRKVPQEDNKTSLSPIET